ncbi:hypothetical protein BC628DRAFT_792749 [Trametes gibbosa]|nr:hypothetical protein BC628DRAFT_792749 [Trametes gibbosa]
MRPAFRVPPTLGSLRHGPATQLCKHSVPSLCVPPRARASAPQHTTQLRNVEAYRKTGNQLGRPGRHTVQDRIASPSLNTGLDLGLARRTTALRPPSSVGSPAQPALSSLGGRLRAHSPRPRGSSTTSPSTTHPSLVSYSRTGNRPTADAQHVIRGTTAHAPDGVNSPRTPGGGESSGRTTASTEEDSGRSEALFIPEQTCGQVPDVP